MEKSADVKDAMLRFYDRLSAGDVSSFDDIVSKEAKLIIGTAPGEWVVERQRMRFGFEAEGVTLQPGKEPVGYAEGQMGWAVDQPLFGLPDGSAYPVRLTMVMRREENTWRIVHGHFSVGVPDEEVVALVKKWAS